MTTVAGSEASHDRPSQPTPESMRRAMGEFASGVTVVTSIDDDGCPVGFTCQAFASVSLVPPLVLFCADHRGRAWPRIRTSGRFCVNILSEDQVDLCRRFGSHHGSKFDGLDWDVSSWHTPTLRDVVLRVHADVTSIHTEGDHDVVVGRVLEIDTVNDVPPMVFHRGGFGLRTQSNPGEESTPDGDPTPPR